jgi:CheY-like chemotaxis protein
MGDLALIDVSVLLHMRIQYAECIAELHDFPTLGDLPARHMDCVFLRIPGYGEGDIPLSPKKEGTYQATILVIDDEEPIQRRYRVALERVGYRVLSANNGKQGLRLLEQEDVDLCIVDIFMPEMDGLELIPLLCKKRPASKLLVISGGTGKMDYLDVAMELGAHATLRKPFSLPELIDAVFFQLKSERAGRRSD